MNDSLALLDCVGLQKMIYFAEKIFDFVFLISALSNDALALLDGAVMPIVNYFDEKMLLYTVAVLSNGALALLDVDVMPYYVGLLYCALT